MSKTAAFLRAWGPALALMGVIFAFSSIPSQEMPSFGLLDFLVKKGGHATGYALLALANLHALKDKAGAGRYVGALLVAVLYAVTDEIHQSFVPGRHPAVADVGIDSLGALAGLALAAWYAAAKKRGGQRQV
jgi:VanZ family protein